MSLVLITLPGAPTVSEEAVKREQLLEDLIEKKVTGNILTRFCLYCFFTLLYMCVLIFTIPKGDSCPTIMHWNTDTSDGLNV